MDATATDIQRANARSVPPARPSQAEAEAAVRVLIAWAGDNPEREGLLDTPARVAKAYGELFCGYGVDPGNILNKVFKDVGGYDDMVLVKDIEFYSHCEHHMVPFKGKAHIAYIPKDGVVGISKLARLVDMFARRLQTQETMTAQIIDALNEGVEPNGVAVFIEAEHMCMSMRGIRAHGASTVTQRFTGDFASDQVRQDRFLALIK